MARRRPVLVPVPTGDAGGAGGAGGAGDAGDAGGATPGGRIGDAGAARQVALAAVLEKVRRRWGQGSIVRLDGESVPNDEAGADGPGARAGTTASAGAGAGATRRRRSAIPPRRLKELPRWWPRAGPLTGPGASSQGAFDHGAFGQGIGHDPGQGIGHDHDAAGARPRVLELVGEAGGGGLSVALAWMAAARPVLIAVVDPAHPAGWFYAPAAAAAGIDLERLIVVRPPQDASRAVLDAAVVLLRSEAFDVVLCPLPADARVSTTFAGTLATLAARSGTTLFLLAPPQARGLGAFADYRVRLGRRRWMWEDGEIVGIRLLVATERARAGAGAELGGADTLPPEYELTLRLQPRARYGPLPLTRAGAPAGERLPTGAPPGTPNHLHLATSRRLLPPAGDTALPAGDTALPAGDTALPATKNIAT